MSRTRGRGPGAHKNVACPGVPPRRSGAHRGPWKTVQPLVAQVSAPLLITPGEARGCPPVHLRFFLASHQTRCCRASTWKRNPQLCLRRTLRTHCPQLGVVCTCPSAALPSLEGPGDRRC
ncbi:uncharacterized protein ACOB7L_014759 [Callospermophilus lateralis]|uniref:uncharacterized protein LOC143397309 n=1 Tax=Callospermophilus lateralis TaxID=76772 RepID=UPI0040543BE4